MASTVCMRACKKNKEVARTLPQKHTTSLADIAKRQGRRKYYTMRRLSFQAVSDKKEKDGSNMKNFPEMLTASMAELIEGKGDVL